MNQIVPDGKKLQDSFFHEQDRKLLDKLRAKLAAESGKEALAAATGIQDEAILERLVSLNILPDTLLALTLVPLVEVAWATGGVDAKERAAILRAAEESGIAEESESHKLLEEWLDIQPGASLLVAWKDYVGGLCRGMSDADRKSLRESLIGRARSVAAASGGFLSGALGNKISAAERSVLEDLEQAFSGHD